MPWPASRLASAVVPRLGELAEGRAPPCGSTAAAAQHHTRPGPGWAWMRARSMSSPSDLRRPVILVAPPSRAVCRSDMHVHGEPFSASDVCTYVPMDEYCVCMDV